MKQRQMNPSLCFRAESNYSVKKMIVHFIKSDDPENSIIDNKYVETRRKGAKIFYKNDAETCGF